MITYIASIDVGTTNTKINLFNQASQLIDTFKAGYQKINNQNDLFEMDFEEIWQIVNEGIRLFINQYEIEELEIILTTAMHSVQLLDREFKLSGEMVTWADRRGHELLPQLSKTEKEKVYQRTGTPIHSMNPYIKLLSIYKSDMKIASIKDLLFYRLTGEWAIDLSNASSSGLLNLDTLDWDQELLTQLGLSVEDLPKIRPVNYAVKTFYKSLQIPIKVVIGTSDGVSSNYIFSDLNNHAVLSIGTSHAIRIVADSPSINVAINNFSYAIDAHRYLIGLASNNGANILAWACDIFKSDFNELNEICINRPIGQAVFIPYINGERAPIWQDSATASLLNLTRNASRESILYAIILGMLFNIKVNVTHLGELVAFDKIGLVGGVTQMTGLTQLIADVLNKELYIPQIENAETMGTIHLVHNVLSKGKYAVVQPNVEATKLLEALFAQYLNELN
ncbi:gluconokinase [Aerococcus sp. L_32]|uniref:gluconokinase n=1 Tax=Aerococcus sp. L_32 TaxID=3422316 RepID=UPI003D6B0A39